MFERPKTVGRRAELDQLHPRRAPRRRATHRGASTPQPSLDRTVPIAIGQPPAAVAPDIVARHDPSFLAAGQASVAGERDQHIRHQHILSDRETLCAARLLFCVW